MSLALIEVWLLALVQPTFIFWLSGVLVARVATRQLFNSSFPLTTMTGIPLGIGLLVRYGAELVTGNSLHAEVFCLVLAFAGILPAISEIKTAWRSRRELDCLRLLPVMVLWMVLAWLCVVSPIIVGDAKVIWFFHSKMIFYAKGINAAAGFTEPAILFSHPDYPKFVATLGAAIANSAGFWNDHLPKFSAALVIAPVFAFLADLVALRRTAMATVLLVSMVSGAGSLLFNGYMDALLGCWAVVLAGALWLIRGGAGVTGGEGPSKVSVLLPFAALAVVMLPSIKYEGLPLAAMFAGVIFWLSGYRRAMSLVRRIPDRGPLLLGILVVILGVFDVAMWRVDCWRWGLENDMSGNIGSMLQRLSARASDWSQWKLCLDYFSTYFAPQWLLLAAGLVAWGPTRKLIPAAELKVIRACFAVGLISSAFFFFVYLGTHHDLDWHLRYSSLRTLLPAQNLFMTGFGMALVSIACAVPRK